jgi:NitT/TauT family transport system substrate-binding protein
LRPIRRTTALALVVVLCAALLAACTPKSASNPQTTATESAPAKVTPAKIRLGNLPTEDILPLWVAEQKGIFKQLGLEVQIVPFQSAQERDAAFTAGGIDGFMGDLIAVGELNSASFPTRVASICLGATPAEGRFGIASAPDSGIRDIKELENVRVGTSSGTIQEYVLDGLMAEAGVATDAVKKEEVKKVPVRYELLMNNELKAAALPEPFLSLAEKKGAHLVADDTKGKNLSQTVLAFSQTFLAKPEGAEAVRLLLEAWNQGAAAVNADPNSYRELLVKQARLPKDVASSYRINQYPKAQLPARQDVEAVLAWCVGKNLVSPRVTYQDMIYEPGQQLGGGQGETAPLEPTATTAPAQ